MRLFGQINGQLDAADRAAWLTEPFDLDFGIVRRNIAEDVELTVQENVEVGMVDITENVIVTVGMDEPVEIPEVVTDVGIQQIVAIVDFTVTIPADVEL